MLEDALSYHSSFECLDDNGSANEDAVTQILLLDSNPEPDQFSDFEMPTIVTHDQESQTLLPKPDLQPFWIFKYATLFFKSLLGR
jgi:hypothetical protein